MVSRKHLIILAAVALLCLLCGFFVGKGMYDRPLDKTVKRDTVTLHDTVPEYLPAPKDSSLTKTVTKWLPLFRSDTVTSVEYYALHDTVAVEVPITSKHYGGKNYDAYVSGFEPSLDSIFVYNETQLITERVTISKPPNKWELDFVGGIDYNTASKDYTPYALGELLYKPNRLQVGIQGGVIKVDNKAEPIVGGKVKVRIF
ncbi:MAG: hypothetical protein IKZ92_03480 [Muribaculaceae bacterium]|nr:hypothetical protein [Muribaculaceae bacterium]